MIFFLNYLFVAVGFVNLLYFNVIKCDVEIINSVPETAKSHPKFCPVTNSKQPVYIPHAENCGSFYICNNGIPHLKSCPLGLHFNPNLKACDYPESAECNKSITRVPKGNTIEEESNFCPAGNLKHPVLIPHPDDCSKFYICDSGLAHLKECRQGLHFNRKLKVCDYPLKAKCDAAHNELPKGKETGDDLCPSENSKYPVFLPHPDDCSKFYVCDTGSALLKECQFGLHFNPKINACDYPNRASCDKGIKMFFAPVQSSFCPPVDGKTPIFFRHSTNCSVYYMCSNGFAYEFVCPSKLHFNIRKRVCDYEWDSNCQTTNQQTKT